MSLFPVSPIQMAPHVSRIVFVWERLLAYSTHDFGFVSYTIFLGEAEVIPDVAAFTFLANKLCNCDPWLSHFRAASPTWTRSITMDQLVVYAFNRCSFSNTNCILQAGGLSCFVTIVRHTKSSPNHVYFVFFSISILIAKYFFDYRYPWYVNISMW